MHRCSAVPELTFGHKSPTNYDDDQGHRVRTDRRQGVQRVEHIPPTADAAAHKLPTGRWQDNMPV
jgi:hypothetical protein